MYALINSSENMIVKIPEGIITAIQKDELAVFVGAGVSMMAKLPGWSELAKELIESCREAGAISYAEEELILRKTSDSKTQITIAYHLHDKKGSIDKFYEIFHKALTLDGLPLGCMDILKWLKSSNALVLTTNADTIIDDLFEPTRIVWDVDKMHEKGLSQSTLVHIHGIISIRDSLVFTTDQYIKRYADPAFTRYLKRVFTEKTVLFLGYGLEEFELLAYLFGDDTQRRHYSLLPYYHYQESIIDAFKGYYDSLKIDLLPYFIDEKGYSVLNEIIHEWHEYCFTITRIPEYSFNRARALALEKPGVENLDELNQIRDEQTNEQIEDAFFSSLIESVYAIDWIELLQDQDFFNPSSHNLPIVESDVDGKKYYHAPGWRGLNILRILLGKNPANELLQRIASEILERICADTLLNTEKKNNWTINGLYTEILCTLPDKYLSKKMIDYLGGMLDSISSDTQILFPIIDKKESINKWSNENKLLLFKETCSMVVI